MLGGQAEIHIPNKNIRLRHADDLHSQLLMLYFEQLLQSVYNANLPLTTSQLHAVLVFDAPQSLTHQLSPSLLVTVSAFIINSVNRH
jgi:hypothetical protein